MEGGEVLPERKERTTLGLSLGVLWACIAFACFLDILGAVEGLGFAPSFQLEAQPLFFIGIAATVFFVLEEAKIGPLLAGVIFWIPIIVLGVDLVMAHDVIPFGGDLVGIAELVIALIGVFAAHNVYHKFQGGLIWTGVFRRRKGR